MYMFIQFNYKIFLELLDLLISKKRKKKPVCEVILTLSSWTMHPVWTKILQAEHFFRGPAFYKEHKI